MEAPAPPIGWPSRAVLALAACAAVACAGGTPEAPAARRPPNLLVVMADDHSADVYGAYGNARVATPNLDALAAEGIRFDRAYANQPVCTPSRQSLLTGRYPHAVGVTLLFSALDESTLSIADHLGAHGYRSAAIGKMHFNSASRHGFDVRLDRRDWREHLARHPPRPVPDDLPVRPEWRPFRDPARIWLNAEARPSAHHEADSEAAWFVDRAVDFMRDEDPRPFLVWLSFYEPHSPFNFPVEYAGRVDPASIEVPRPGPEDGPQIPLVFADLTEDEKRGITAAYYQSVMHVDTQVGRALSAVDGLGLRDDTVVLYLSDHGYHLGHHGRFEKHSFFERAVRTPLVARGPGIPAGTSTDALVELVDVFPTLAELAGAPPAEGRHGHSLVPLLRGGDAMLRHHVFATYTQNGEGMIRTDRWKLVYGRGQEERADGYVDSNPTPGRWRRLYDTVEDPEELRNLADEPEQRERLRELEALLLKRLKETWPADIGIPEAPPLEQLDFLLQSPERLRDPALTPLGRTGPEGAAG